MARPINLKASLVFDENLLKQEIIKAMLIPLNEALMNAALDIKKEVSNLIRVMIRESPEYESILRGVLRIDLGLEDPYTCMNEIINILANEVYVTVIPMQISRNRLRGGLSIKLIKGDYSDILSSYFASYISNGGLLSSEVYVIDWLEWLITRGDSIIISDHYVRYTTKWPSRSGGGIMVKGRKGFRIRPQFSGTRDNNFITRAFDNPVFVKTLSDIVERELAANL